MTERGIRLCTPFSTTVSHHASAAVATRDQAGGADKFLSVLMFGLALLRLHFDGNGFASQIPPPVDNTTPPPASSSMDATEWAIRFLEDRVQRDPLDFIAFNKLATYYLQRLRETGGLQYLDLASNSARASLAAMPAGQNTGGLTALAQVEYALHHFAEAIQLARQASQGDPRNTSASFIAGDAYLELGQDAEAEKLYRALEHSNPSPEVTVRLARLAELRGNHHETIELMRRAVSESQGRKNPDGSAVWYHIRLGEVYFRTGEFQQAEEQFEAALKTWPGHYLALEHLA